MTEGRRCPGKDLRLMPDTGSLVVPETAWGGKLCGLLGICPMFEEEGWAFWEREEEEEVLGLCMREASEREEELEEVERLRDEDEGVLGLGIESTEERPLFREKEEDEVEGCRDVDEEVLGLGIPSTRAAATAIIKSCDRQKSIVGFVTYLN